MNRCIVWLSLVCCLIINESCREKPDHALNQTPAQREATFASLTQVNDYPFFTMSYIGDYGLREYLNTGQWPTPVFREGRAAHYACTCFAALHPDSGGVFGRNFDWNDHCALLLATHPPDGYASVSMILLSVGGITGSNPPGPDSTRDALLLTPFWPVDGMNECGVAIGLMAVDRADPPFDPAKRTLSCLTVIRLVLDYAKDASEAIQLIRSVNVDFTGGEPVHYLLADGNGRSAIVEFVDHEVKVIENSSRWHISTNFIVTGTQAPLNVSCWRYNTVQAALARTGGAATPAEALDLLRRVSQGPPYGTMWSMVYNIKNLSIDIVIDRKYDEKYHFNATDFGSWSLN